MKFFAPACVGKLSRAFVLFTAVTALTLPVRAGLTFTLDIYALGQGQGFVFYTPLVTNSILPAAPLGSYFISSPQWPTNGATRGFQMTAIGLTNINSADQEGGYVDVATTLQQITNGNWTILFTNATTTNLYTFTVSIPVSATTNLLIPTIITFPADGSFILTNQTTFTWQGPTNWPVSGTLQTYNNNGYYQATSLPASQTNWVVDSSLPAETNYTFRVGYVTNYTIPVFVATTPTNTKTLQPISSGWASSNIVESGSSVSFTVIPANGGGPDFNSALGTTGLNWSTTGDSAWFIESTNTDNGAPYAAQSGNVINNQSSTLSVTVTGPGTLTYYWASQDDCSYFDYQFAIDGVEMNDISCSQSWEQDGPYTIPAGQHTLSWTTYAYGDTDPTEAGFLDQVSFVAGSAPVITLDPFNQTNYPGYSVALLAAATGNPAPTWKWYEVGNASPIPNATEALFIPTNSGTSGVQGGYYAVASNSSGSANTTTAAVNFVSTQLPPDWSTAFKSAFSPVNTYVLTEDYYYGCVLDTNGNVCAAGEFGGNTTFGTLNLSSGSGGDAAVVIKQTPAGLPLWAVGITNNGGGNSAAYDVAPAPGGGVYLSGNYNGNNWLGTNSLTDAGGGDIFIARFDGNGSNFWVKTFGTTSPDSILINSLAADPSGNVTVSGSFGSGSLTVGSSNYVFTGQQEVLFQLDQTGAVRWSQLVPEFIYYLTYNSGRLYASLQTETIGGTTNIVIGGVSNITDRAWAAACLNDTNGQTVWVRGVGAPYGSANGNPYATPGLADDAPCLAISGTNVFLTGVAYNSNAAFGAITVNFGDLRGQYFARYDTNGNAQVATTYGSVTTTPIAAVADAKGDVYVSGDFDTFADFGNDLIATPVATRPYNGGFSQAFLAKFDLNGNALWARDAVASSYGSVNFEGIALAADGVWASGWCQSGYYPQTIPSLFGTNSVYSDPLWVSGGAGGGTIIVWYPAGVLAKVTDNAAVATPVTLIDSTNAGTSFQFQFLSESGFNHNILYRTNLAVGAWLTNSTVSGDGTVKTISLPFSLFSPSRQGFIRVSTQ
jgi:hypothetical protein